MKDNNLISSSEFHLKKMFQRLEDPSYSLSEGYEDLTEEEIYLLANPKEFRKLFDALKKEIGEEKYKEYLCIVERAHNFSDEASEDDMVEYVVEEAKKIGIFGIKRP